ncbi:hypothetical protein NL676_034189 [Syzygium grande]|nr:hypothetical protein NL676_034189 [Syzygium grande]
MPESTRDHGYSAAWTRRPSLTIIIQTAQRELSKPRSAPVMSKANLAEHYYASHSSLATVVIGRNEKRRSQSGKGFMAEGGNPMRVVSGKEQ